MKKLLALVLALVMSMSLVTISNAAFKDADKIDYKEAVDVMNAVGVFIGDEKGNFNAKENLTREQAAKIIAYLELGSKAADALVGSNIFNVFMILGCSAAIKPLPSYPGFVLDSIMAALGCVLVWVFVMTNKKHQIRWWHGAIMLLVYGGYLGWRLVTA